MTVVKIPAMLFEILVVGWPNDSTVQVHSLFEGSNAILTRRFRLYFTRHIHTYIPPFNGPLSGTTRVRRYQKGKTIWILLKQEAVASAAPYASLHLTPDT